MNLWVVALIVLVIAVVVLCGILPAAGRRMFDHVDTHPGDPSAPARPDDPV